MNVLFVSDYKKQKSAFEAMLNRGSLVTFNVPYDELTHAEKKYITNLVNDMLAEDTSRGGYAAPFKKYVRYGGRMPRDTKLAILARGQKKKKVKVKGHKRGA